MKKAALTALLLVVLVPLQAKALDTEELLGLVAMPLAVAAASEVTGVPVGDLSHFVATLNRAQVPPTQIVQVVRYAPAAFVVEDQQQTFIEYVDYEVDRGVTGPQLVNVIEDRYRTYDLEPQFLTFDDEEPATTYVVRDDYIPELVVTRVAQVRPSYVVGDTNDLLALAAMPLAVAAVADITGIPLSDLSGLVASFNAARVPPMQIVEVLRYLPVVMVDDVERPRFVQFVNTQVGDGVTGTRLVNAIDDRLRTYDVTPQFDQPVTVVDQDNFFPQAVTTRVAEVRAHPHGGPPGQLKKERGLQTGAEVVHGTRAARTSRDDKPARVTARSERSDDARVVRKARSPEPKIVKQRVERSEQRVDKQPKVDKPPKVEKQHKVEKQRIDAPKQKPDRGQGQGKGKGEGKGKGKG